MGTVIGLLWEYKTVIIIGILVLATMAMYQYTNIVKKDRDAAVALSNSLRTELSISQQSEQKLETSISDQNKQIDAFKKDADTRLQQHQTELAQADVTSKIINQHASDILATKPLANTTACINANTLLNQELANAIKK